MQLQQSLFPLFFPSMYIEDGLLLILSSVVVGVLIEFVRCSTFGSSEVVVEFSGDLFSGMFSISEKSCVNRS